MSSSTSVAHNYRVTRSLDVLHLICLIYFFLDSFTKPLEDDLKAAFKPQYVDQLPRAVKTPDKPVRFLFERGSARGNMDDFLETLELRRLLDRDTNLLSGGELQVR
ncbi:hypothetical protein F5Y09DRAFT_301392 [Xylaria sp. FL1042]|nr:hypothetical protein F5Y09DRAFT_301392 [Xylaria sp. FL1042]